MVDSYTQKLGWSVGLQGWLDSPASKVNRYWRKVEEGQVFTGLTLIGLWGDRAGSNLRPGSVREGPLASPGEGAGQKFVPFGMTSTPDTALRRARFAFWYYITKGRMGRPTNADLSILHGKPSSGKGKGRHGSDPTATANRRIFGWIMSKAPLGSIPFVSARAARKVEARRYYINAQRKFHPEEYELRLLHLAVEDLMGGTFNRKKAHAASARETGASPKDGPVQGSQKAIAARLEDYNARASLGYGLGYGSQGLASMGISAAGYDFLRTGGGRFPSGLWQNMLIEVNRKVAEAFQLAVVAEMQEGPHLRLPTHDLIAAAKDPRNRIPR